MQKKVFTFFCSFIFYLLSLISLEKLEIFFSCFKGFRNLPDNLGDSRNFRNFGNFRGFRKFRDILGYLLNGFLLRSHSGLIQVSFRYCSYTDLDIVPNSGFVQVSFRSDSDLVGFYSDLVLRSQRVLFGSRSGPVIRYQLLWDLLPGSA